jgi:cob(I)alamin adenosyltransferase
MFGDSIMGYRLSKIVTRTGDDGTTGLADGTRVQKDSARIQAIGSVDELNSNLGLLLSETLPPEVTRLLLRVQNELFDLGGSLAFPVTPFSEDKVLHLDVAITLYNRDLPPLTEFILPGGTKAASLCHVARTVARRTERDLVALAHAESVPQHALAYVNRLSDLLFVLCRVINRGAEQNEILWARISPDN